MIWSNLAYFCISSFSFQFQSHGARLFYHCCKLLSATTVYFLLIYLLSFLNISILILGTDIISSLSKCLVVLLNRLCIHNLLSLSASFFRVRSLYHLGFFILWRNVFLDRSHISQKGANVITQKWSSREPPFSIFV